MSSSANLMCDLFYYSYNLRYDDNLFYKLWSYDAQELVNIMFYLRRHKNHKSPFVSGRGKRDIFYKFIIWMSHHHLSNLLSLLSHIPSQGCWKDLLFLFNTPAEPHIIDFFL